MELTGNDTHSTEMKNNVQYTGVKNISEVKIIFRQNVMYNTGIQYREISITINDSVLCLHIVFTGFTANKQKSFSPSMSLTSKWILLTDVRCFHDKGIKFADIIYIS